MIPDAQEQMKKRVAFQGERGAFSEEAAVKLLGEEIELVPRATFEQLFTSVAEGKADYVLAPIENSLAGSVHRSYDLLLESSLAIQAEVIIPITHNIIALQGALFESIKTVQSHPVALAQCERFFAAHPHIRRIAAEDTAGSVRQVVEHGDPTHAAIAGKRAAVVYGGSILREHLEDHSENYTRFVLLAATLNAPDAPSASCVARANKLSLVMEVGHTPGALHKSLEPFAERGIDLLKIESRPIVGCPWQYRFYLDLRLTTNEREVKRALAELAERTLKVRILGCYPTAEMKEVSQIQSPNQNSSAN